MSGRTSEGLVTVHEAAGEFEARTVVAVLEDAGIEAFVFPLANIPIPDPFRPGPLGRVPVQVAASDAERARAAIAAARDDAGRIDWDEVDVGEPTPEVEAALGRWPAPGRFRFLALSVVAIAVVLALVAILSAFPWSAAR